MTFPARDAVTHGHSSSETLPLHDVSPAEALRAWFGELARAGVLASGSVERRPLLEAAGRVAAVPVVALHADPVAPCAAMDGIAVVASDVATATDAQPVLLARDLYAVTDTGQAVAACWDSVIPSEQLEQQAGGVVVRAPVARGSHVRPAGENVEAGATIIAAGRRLTAYDVALAAACGHTALTLHARPRVAVIPTGDEIRPVGAPLAPGEATDTSSTMLSILLRETGAEVSVTAIVPDRPGLLEQQVRDSSREAELVLIIAGSARGTRDRTASVLESLGTTVVRGVALRPAHPVILGRVGTVAVVGMPGYPVSTAFAFERFARPLVELLSGLSAVTEPIRLPVRLASSIRGRRDAEVQVPVWLGNGPDDLLEAHPGSRRGSALASLARAHAIVSVPAGCDLLEAGDVVYAELLSGAAPPPGSDRDPRL